MASCKPVLLAHKKFEDNEDVREDNPIIFLHGYSGCKEHWHDIPQKVAEATHRRVYAVDARNHGDSEWSDEFSFDINADDLIHFIEYIGAEKVTIIGHSMGGITCMKTALKIPTKIDKMIVEDIGITVCSEIFLSIRMLLGLFQQALLELPKCTCKEASKFLSDYVYDRVPDEAKHLLKKEDDQYIEYLKQNSDGTVSFRSNINLLTKAIEDKDSLLSKYEGVFDGPACFIYGKKSRLLVGEQQETIKNFFPNAQFVGIEDATHSVHSDAPEPFMEALLNFLQD